MKKSFSFFSFAENVNYSEAIKNCKTAGFEGVEFVLSDNGTLNMHTSDSHILSYKRCAEDCGLKISSIGAWNLWDHNMVSDDSKIREEAKDIVKREIDIAQMCGADTVLVVPGYVGTSFAKEIIDYEKAYERAEESLGVLAKYAMDAGVNIGVENVWNKFLLSPLEMRRFLEEINSSWVGAYFDVGNIIYIGYPDQWIKILGKKFLKKVHFCDCRADGCGLSMFVDLLAGDVDFQKVRERLAEVEYDDWAVVEYFPNYKKYPYVALKNASNSLDAILNIKISRC